MIANAPWYVPYITLHEDLCAVSKESQKTKKHKIPQQYLNVLIQLLLQPHNETRLKRNWPADLRED
jgi:hypothetical protein